MSDTSAHRWRAEGEVVACADCAAAVGTPEGSAPCDRRVGPALDSLVLGDALTVMATMPNGSVDLVVTSPPYNLKNSTGNGMKDGRGSLWESAALRDGYTNQDDSMPHDEYVSWQRKILDEAMRVTADDGAIFYNHKWRVQAGLLQDRADIVEGFPVRQIIIWRRSGGINFNRGYFLPTFEVIYLIAKPKFRLAPKACSHGDIWDIPQERDNPHPAPYPLALAERIIGSTESEIILDPFSGSGTTALAAHHLGRHFIGIENSPQYHAQALDRLEQSYLAPRMF